MFQNRYMTRGVSLEIPFYIQNVMWVMIDSMEIDKKDYLQIFELSKVITDGKVFQKITHRQEQPEYEKSVAILANEEAIIIKKVFVIDDVIYCTMLLAEEY